MAGAMIGIAGFVNLAIGGVYGAFLFSFGLISVYCFQLALFTGMAGRTPYTIKDHNRLWFALIGNIIGAAAVALLARTSPMNLQECAQKILSTRLLNGWWKDGCLAIGCGFIVEEAVYMYRTKSQILPTILGVMVFVLCGFPHCVADAFYFTLVPCDFLSDNIAQVLGVYIPIVAGNYVGCNLRRWLKL